MSARVLLLSREIWKMTKNCVMLSQSLGSLLLKSLEVWGWITKNFPWALSYIIWGAQLVDTFLPMNQIGRKSASYIQIKAPNLVTIQVFRYLIWNLFYLIAHDFDCRISLVLWSASSSLKRSDWFSLWTIPAKQIFLRGQHMSCFLTYPYLQQSYLNLKSLAAGCSSIWMYTWLCNGRCRFG